MTIPLLVLLGLLVHPAWTRIIEARMMLSLKLILALALLAVNTFTFQLTWALPQDVARASLPDLYEASIAELQEGLEKRQFTSVDLVKVRRSNVWHPLSSY